MCITKKQQQAIAKSWADRAQSHGLRPHTTRYKDAMWHYVAGACAALHHTDETTDDTPDKLSALVPVMWVIAGISGRNPWAEEEEAADAPQD